MPLALPANQNENARFSNCNWPEPVGAALDPRSTCGYVGGMSAKELALDVIKNLPDNATMHDLTEELYAAAVREGLAELDRGEGVPHEEVKRQFESWFTK
jgi:hypothetical protein